MEGKHYLLYVMWLPSLFLKRNVSIKKQVHLLAWKKNSWAKGLMAFEEKKKEKH